MLSLFRKKTELINGTGCLHKNDSRDFKATDLKRFSDSAPFDWDKGYNVYEELGIQPEFQDQNGSLSCVAQAYARYHRVMWKFLTGEERQFSPHWTYLHIFIGDGGGAYIRDGAAFLATRGGLLESMYPSYDNGKPPSERYMTTFLNINVDSSVSKGYDKFEYRLLDPQIDNVEVWAKGIVEFNGVVAGFRGDNDGWCRPDIKPPLNATSTWGHAVYLCGAGRLDVNVGEHKAGHRGFFTNNSWGGRYTITEGRWKGMQFIPVEYFGWSGKYVSAGFVLTPEETVVSAEIRQRELASKYDKSLIRNNDTGAFGLCYHGELKVIDDSRAGLAALTMHMDSMWKTVTLDGKTWNEFKLTLF